MLIIAIFCYIIVAILSCVFGTIYLTRSQFMPYHSQALNKQWQELENNYQTLILALMRVAGGGFLATGISIFLLIRVYYTTQENSLLIIMTTMGLITSLGSLLATILVKTKTSASPPFGLSLVSIILIITGASFAFIS